MARSASAANRRADFFAITTVSRNVTADDSAVDAGLLVDGESRAGETRLAGVFTCVDVAVGDTSRCCTVFAVEIETGLTLCTGIRAIIIDGNAVASVLFYATGYPGRGVETVFGWATCTGVDRGVGETVRRICSFADVVVQQEAGLAVTAHCR